MKNSMELPTMDSMREGQFPYIYVIEIHDEEGSRPTVSEMKVIFAQMEECANVKEDAVLEGRWRRAKAVDALEASKDTNRHRTRRELGQGHKDYQENRESLNEVDRQAHRYLTKEMRDSLKEFTSACRQEMVPFSDDDEYLPISLVGWTNNTSKRKAEEYNHISSNPLRTLFETVA